MILPIHIITWIVSGLFLALKKRPQETKWIFMGIIWNLVNFRVVWSKRKEVQLRVRKVQDKDFMPKILKKMSLRYMMHILRRY